MSKTTENLELFEYDTQTDGKQKFNITKALNNNFDKIDTATGKLSELVTEDKSSLVKAINEAYNNIELSNEKASVDLDNLSSIGQAILDKKVEIEALLETNGYAKFSWKDGNKLSSLIIQWGNTKNVRPVTFATAYANNKWVLVTAQKSPTPPNLVYTAIYDNSAATTGFQWTTIDGAVTQMYLAIGY